MKERYFVDYGNYHEIGDPSEIYIRKEMKGEIYDICNMGCDETNFPLDNAKAICEALNARVQSISN